MVVFFLDAENIFQINIKLLSHLFKNYLKILSNISFLFSICYITKIKVKNYFQFKLKTNPILFKQKKNPLKKVLLDLEHLFVMFRTYNDLLCNKNLEL